jgi:hypothetical protein
MKTRGEIFRSIHADNIDEVVTSCLRLYWYWLYGRQDACMLCRPTCNSQISEKRKTLGPCQLPLNDGHPRDSAFSGYGATRRLQPPQSCIQLRRCKGRNHPQPTPRKPALACNTKSATMAGNADFRKYLSSQILSQEKTVRNKARIFYLGQ